MLNAVRERIEFTAELLTISTGQQLVFAVESHSELSTPDLVLLRLLDSKFPARLHVRFPPGSAPLEVIDSAGQQIGWAVRNPKNAAEAQAVGASLADSLATAKESATRDTVVMAARDWAPGLAEQFVIGLSLGLGEANCDVQATPGRIQVALPDQGTREAVDRGIAITSGILFARQLANMPSNTKSPEWLSQQALGLASADTSVDVLAVEDLTELGFGGVLAVGQGSERPANVTVLRRGSPDKPPRVLVGKGITFDSGGLSIKSAAGMPLMKTDMSGAASVLGTFAALEMLSCDEPVVGVIACAENMPGAQATRPSDVITHFGGRTTEVLNTDAEGRLVLGDALAYAVDVFHPSAIVDIATLTGSATVGLGRGHAALFCDDPGLLAELLTASAESQDVVWRLPLPADYKHALDSDVADAANVNTDPNIMAGSITAALFLRPFAGSTPWAHLDIAGVGRREAGKPGHPKGATGFGVDLFVSWIDGNS
jgi:leucyl aminopeptidase